MERRTLSSLALALACLGLFPAPAGAAVSDHHGVPPEQAVWSNCSWGWIGGQPNSPAPIFWDYAGSSLPDARYRQRVEDALRRWNDRGRSFPKAVEFRRGSNPEFGLKVRYSTPPNGAPRGTTEYETHFGTYFCQLRVDTPDRLIARTDIYMRPRGDWFADADGDRSSWESYCRGPGQYTTYCQTRRYDFGSTFTHEVGHVFLLKHPSQAPSITYYNHHCNTGARSTMCVTDAEDYGGQFDGSRRTLERADVDSLYNHQLRAGS